MATEQDEALFKALENLIGNALVEYRHDTFTRTIVAEHIWNAGWRPVVTATEHKLAPYPVKELIMYGLKVTDDTVDYVIGFGDALGVALSFLRSSITYAAKENESLYVVTDKERFIPYLASEFFSTWKFVDEKNDKFSEIVHI